MSSGSAGGLGGDGGKHGRLVSDGLHRGHPLHRGDLDVGRRVAAAAAHPDVAGICAAALAPLVPQDEARVHEEGVRVAGGI